MSTQPLIETSVANDDITGTWYFTLGAYSFSYDIIKADGKLFFHDQTNYSELKLDQGWLIAKVSPINSQGVRSSRILRLKHTDGMITSNLSQDADGETWDREVKATKQQAEGASKPKTPGAPISVFQKEPLNGLPGRDLLGLSTVDPHIRVLMNQAAADPGIPLPMTVAAAPAVGSIQHAMMILLVFYVLFLPGTNLVQQCPSKPSPVGIVENSIVTPAWYGIPVYTIFVGFYLLREVRALGFILPIQLQALGDFRFLAGHIVLNISRFSYNAFKVFYLGLSFLGHVGIVSNGLFVSRLLKAHYCENESGIHSMVEDLWRHTLEQSYMLKSLPLDYFKIWHLVLLAWCLKTLQFLHAFVWAFPVGKKDRQHTVEGRCMFLLRAVGSLLHFSCVQCCGWRRSKSFKVDYELPASFSESQKFEYEYKTLFNHQQNHGAAFQVIADVVKFTAVRSLDFRFAVSRMRRTAKEDSTDLEAIWRYLHHAQNQMAHAISGFLFTGIFENMFFLHLQISLMGISMNLPTDAYTSGHHYMHSIPTDFFQFIHSTSFLLIVVNLMLSLLKFIDAISVFLVYMEVRTRVLGWRSLLRSGTPEANLPLAVWKSMSWRFLRYLVYVASYMWLLVLAFAKVWAIFYCPCKLWNLTGGCASLDGTRALCDAKA